MPTWIKSVGTGLDDVIPLRVVAAHELDVARQQTDLCARGQGHRTAVTREADVFTQMPVLERFGQGQGRAADGSDGALFALDGREAIAGGGDDDFVAGHPVDGRLQGDAGGAR